MTAFEPHEPMDLDRLATLQCETLPTSLISKLGHSYVSAFYRYVVTSPQELVLAARDQAGKIAAGCVVSLEAGSLQRRLLTGTPLLLAALPRALTLLPQMMRGGTGQSPEGPELLLLFTDPAQRGKGLAGSLLEQAEAELKARGILSYVVRTFDDPADPAVRFYRGKGFVPTGSFTAYGSAFQLLTKDL